MQRWDLAESILPHFRHQRQHTHFMSKIRFISIAILCLTFCISICQLNRNELLLIIKIFPILVEHFFYVAAMLHFVTTVDSEQDPLTFIVENSVPYTFSTTQTQSISIWMAIPINFISITSTFVWNYLDALILIISIGLSTLFELFNDQLMETQEVHAHAIIILIVLFTKLTKLTAFSYCSKCRSNFGPIEEFNMSSCVT